MSVGHLLSLLHDSIWAEKLPWDGPHLPREVASLSPGSWLSLDPPLPTTGESLPQHKPRGRETGVMQAEEGGVGTRRRS